ncbi:MAG TPA: 3-phosphoshikimate 1-carboxyvinyltransferase [Dehalococcoidia bacterium]|nr:3-phosphoshikimate 1-carboxyvinyltransferase [Dehalococcoidia bacterium]
MSLPDVIEIVPPQRPAPALVTIPGSKSITNRALVLAALADGHTTLHGALWSEDTEIMVAALRMLGFDIEVSADASEPGNCTIALMGLGGRIPRAGSAAAPLEIYVGNAGTVARFLLPLLCLGHGVYRMKGTPRMHQRPQSALIDALRQLGYRIEAQDGRLPATVVGESASMTRRCSVGIEESSQFASALLLSSGIGGWDVEVTGEDAEESAYVAMTSKLIEAFPAHGGDYWIEPDCSSASYFLAAGALLPETQLQINAWPESDWQIDARFVEFLRRFETRDGHNLNTPVPKDERGPAEASSFYPDVSRIHDLGDAIMTAIVVAPLMPRPSRFVDLGRLRVQESERAVALRTELTKCGARVVEQQDTLQVFPSQLHGAEIDTYDDHRIAMCFATLGLAVPGMRIREPNCVKKTFPNFFAKIAEAAPAGLGATILDAATKRPLSGDELLAD